MSRKAEKRAKIERRLRREQRVKALETFFAGRAVSGAVGKVANALTKFATRGDLKLGKGK